jgi:hypothetical protein
LNLNVLHLNDKIKSKINLILILFWFFFFCKFRLSDEIDELKNLPVRNNDEDVFTLRRECNRFQEDLKTARIERDILQQDIDHKQNLIKKYENDLKGQPEIVAYLNNQVIKLFNSNKKMNV